MNNREILLKVIEKAEKNGFDNGNITCFDVWDIPDKLYVRFLFCEDFAKAFWKKEYTSFRQEAYDYQDWKYHLQQMVLEKNPLKYLEKFL
jgi:hypothetical protein